MYGLLRRVEASLAAFDVRSSRVLGVARSTLALAQISVLLFTPAAYLFVPVGTEATGPSCDAFNSWTAYCLPWEFSDQTTSWLLVACLLVVISGWFPRLTGLLHVWITFSISSAIRLPDGGESAAQVISVFLALVLLSDTRSNHWSIQSLDEPPSVLAPISWAALWGLRLQVCWIYLSASIAKLAVQEWQEGSAIYYVTRQVFFGVNGPLAEFFL